MQKLMAHIDGTLSKTCKQQFTEIKHVQLEPSLVVILMLLHLQTNPYYSNKKKEHWKNDKTQSATAHHTKSIKKAKAMRHNQQFQINFPTWETMQKLGDVLQLWVIK